jgi:hypothetical protein
MAKVHKPAFILGAVLLAIGVLWALNQWHFRTAAAAAEGLVVDVVVETDAKGSRMYSPVVEFTDTLGERFRFQEGVAVTGSPFFDKGERVPVLYERENPARAQIDSFSSSWLVPLLFAAFGLIFMWVARIIGKQDG